VESRYGKIKAVAKVFPGLMPDALAMPLGKEDNFPPKKEARKKTDPLVLLPKTGEDQAGLAPRPTTRVKIYKTRGRSR
jgi:anaerobic selenocysteine-containing dehydrogenase